MTDDYDLALRRDRAADDPDVMDDIVVRNVNMFRAEAMDDTNWWLCCYLGDPSGSDRIAFSAQVSGGKLVVRMTEQPQGDYVHEPPTPTGTPERRATAMTACVALGPVMLDTENMTSDHGFSRGDLLSEHVEAVVDALGIREGDRRRLYLGAAVLRRLVVEHLVVPLATEGISVVLRGMARNPARAHTVSGLTNNEHAVPYRSATVDGAVIAAAVLAALDGAPATEPAPGRHESAMADGLDAMVGRQVEVQMSGNPDENLCGRLVAVSDAHLVIAQDSSEYDSERLGVVPLGQVWMVSSRQLTDDEYQLFDDI